MEDQITSTLTRAYKDMDWFEANSKEFKKKYNNLFVAFKDKTVLDSDADLDTLLKRLKSRNVEVSSLFIEFVSTINKIL
jgi:hypothetical protein